MTLIWKALNSFEVPWPHFCLDWHKHRLNLLAAIIMAEGRSWSAPSGFLWRLSALPNVIGNCFTQQCLVLICTLVLSANQCLIGKLQQQNPQCIVTPRALAAFLRGRGRHKGTGSIFYNLCYSEAIDPNWQQEHFNCSQEPVRHRRLSLGLELVSSAAQGTQRQLCLLCPQASSPLLLDFPGSSVPFGSLSPLLSLTHAHTNMYHTRIPIQADSIPVQAYCRFEWERPP